jgi:Phage integrase family
MKIEFTFLSRCKEAVDMLDEPNTAVSRTLTPSRIAAATPCGRTLWLADDDGIKGHGRLLLRISPSNTRIFYFRQEFRGERKTFALGHYSRTSKAGFLTLQEARDAAARLRRVRGMPTLFVAPPVSPAPPALTALAGLATADTELPAGAMPTASSDEKRPMSLLELTNLYVQDLLKRGKTKAAGATQGLIKLYIAPSLLATRPANAIASEEFVELLGVIVEGGKGRTAGQVRQLLHASYQLATKAKLNPALSGLFRISGITYNPIKAIESLSDLSEEGERHLSLTQTRAFWRRLNPADESTLSLAQRFNRLNMLLGGQRSAQLARVPRTAVDLKNRTILLYDPKGRRKKARAHLLPLVDSAMRDVQYFLDFGQYMDSKFLFPSETRSGTALSTSAVSKWVHSCSQEMLKAEREEDRVESSFCFGDLRRTIETILSEHGVTEQLCAHLQSHGLTGVQIRHYNKYSYLKEKREILEMWEMLLNAKE